MRPLSPRKRWAYLFVFVALFCIVVPIAILYAGGWRYKEGFGFVRTGGIFVSVPYDGASVSLDGRSVGESGFLNRRLYLNDLAPSAYTVRVEKEGYRPWEKVLVVEPQLVTDAQALLISDDLEALKLVVGKTATGTKSVTPEQSARIAEAFAHPVASSSPEALATGDMAIVLANGDVLVRWQGTSRPPSVFCGRPSYCSPQIPIERSREQASAAAFFGGGVVYATKEGGIYFSEADVRPIVATAELFPQAGARFRIVDGALYIEYRKAFYEVTGL